MMLAALAARLFQYAAASALFGMPLFHALGLTISRDRTGGDGGLRPALSAAALLVVISNIAWAMAQAAYVTDDISSAWDYAVVWDIVSSTHVGHMALLRVGLAAGALLLPFVSLPGSIRIWLQTALGATLLGTLAWSGHGDITPGWVGRLHLAADVVHLWSAASWLSAIVAFCITAGRLLSCAGETDRDGFCRALERFAQIGSVTVAAIVFTGLTNSWFLIGPGWRTALSTRYGQVMLVKLLLFTAMLVLVASNRFILTPSLRVAIDRNGMASHAIQRVRTSLAAEAIFGTLVLLTVSYLGTLPPPLLGTAAAR